MRTLLKRAFKAAFGAAPAFRVVVPGRVNLIGDHIDYNGLSVLPMAMQRHVTLLVRPRPDAIIRIRSMDPRFEERSFELDPAPVPFPAGDWGNYAKAALSELYRDLGSRRGFDALVESDIPVAAGLSSSSALVVAFGLALLHANGRSVPPLRLADRLARAEHYVGTRGGGMDQAVLLGARQGCALRIDFDPLAVTPIPVPGDWRFVVAFSAVPAEKSGALRDAYNQRATECRDALEEVRARLGMPSANYSRLVDEYAQDDLARLAAGLSSTALRLRFTHVVTEAVRVRRAESAMREAQASAFGALMTESHASLRDAFTVSTPVLDRLAADCVRGGALGARLTGAGFGGCVVALADEESWNPLRTALARGYYAERNVSGVQLDQWLFVAHPSGNAVIEDPLP